ncbi:MAG TPA: RNA polymerase sigma factor [Roseiarcus sp.]|nr:RNA polymerase sigma factor [Roseiarcus sp.]
MASRDEMTAGLSERLARLWRYGFVLSKSRDIAEDLVQATCLRALERAYEFKSGAKLDRWLFAILRSIWLNEIRARRTIEVQGNAKSGKVQFSGAENRGDISGGQVLTAVDQLPEAQREAVLLVYVEGMSYREAGEFLGTPVGAISSQLASARVSLGKLSSTNQAGAMDGASDMT